MPNVGDVITQWGRQLVWDGFGYGLVPTAVSVPMIYPVRTMAQLGDASAQQNYVYRCTDAPGGEAIVYSDGANWLRQYDSSPVNA